MTHTPGPWGIFDGDHETDVYVYAVDRDAMVAQVRGDDGLNYEANARLIAAAPDLLEAAIAAVPELRGEGMNFAVYDALRAAIQKATGVTA